jgi:hypothetical protein
MAIYHATLKVFSRSNGHSAVSAAAYRAGAELFCEYTGQKFNFCHKREVAYSQILAPKNAQEWVFDRANLWNKVEASEKRKDSQLCREMELALPIELNLEQHIDLIRDFLSPYIELGMVADFSIHNKHKNPHVHILLTMRHLENDGFGKKATEWNPDFIKKKGKAIVADKNLIMEFRTLWADCINAALSKHGHTEQVDHRSFKDLGIDKEPTIHVGRNNSEVVAGRKKHNDRTIWNNSLNAQIAALDESINYYEKNIENYEDEIICRANMSNEDAIQEAIAEETLKTVLAHVKDKFTSIQKAFDMLGICYAKRTFINDILKYRDHHAGWQTMIWRDLMRKAVALVQESNDKRVFESIQKCAPDFMQKEFNQAANEKKSGLVHAPESLLDSPPPPQKVNAHQPEMKPKSGLVNAPESLLDEYEYEYEEVAEPEKPDYSDSPFYIHDEPKYRG